MPAIVLLQETVAVPEPPLILLGVIGPQVRPEGAMSVRATEPVKPFTGVTVTLETAEDPTFTSAGRLAAIMKSWKMKVAFAEWTSDVLVPMTVRV